MMIALNRYDPRGLGWATSLANAQEALDEQLIDLATGFFVTDHPGHRAAASLTSADTKRLRATARALRHVFESEDEDAAVRQLNDVLASSGARPEITRHDELGWHLHHAAEGARASDLIAATAAMALATLICDAGTERLGFCAAAGCDQAFIDLSKNGRKRYCSSRCATRESVAAHRRRSREQA